MLLPKTIPPDGIQTVGDVRYDPDPVESLYAREVIDLTPLVVEEKPSRSMTTLHTVLREPNLDQRMVMEQIAALSDRLIVMSRQSADILQEVFLVSPDKIDLIPHGIPDLHFTDPNFYKDAFGTEGKDVLLTFGLLSPNKGIENVIQALPSILSRHSNAVYMISASPTSMSCDMRATNIGRTCRNWREISGLRPV